MAEQSPETQKQLAVKIAASANSEEKHAIRIWIEHLLALKATNLPTAQKAKQAISLTVNDKVVLPIVKIIAREIKRLAWDERGLQGRLGLGGAAVGVALFGGQGAGIAALGTAIGVRYGSSSEQGQRSPEFCMRRSRASGQAPKLPTRR